MQIVLALPPYNEEEVLPPLLEAFRREVLSAGYEGRVVIVDDGSTDGTRRVIDEWSQAGPIELVEHTDGPSYRRRVQCGLPLSTGIKGREVKRREAPAQPRGTGALSVGLPHTRGKGLHLRISRLSRGAAPAQLRPRRRAFLAAWTTATQGMTTRQGQRASRQNRRLARNCSASMR